MRPRSTAVIAFCSGLVGFALAYFAVDPSQAILNDASSRLVRLEKQAADLHEAAAEAHPAAPRVVDLRPDVLNPRIFTYVDQRPAWMDVAVESPAFRFTVDDGQYPMPTAQYGWKAVISNKGNKPLDACAYVRILDHERESVAAEVTRIVLPPFTSRQFRGVIPYRAFDVSRLNPWQKIVRDVSIVFDPEEVQRIADRDYERRRQAKIRNVITPFIDDPDYHGAAKFHCY